MSITATQEPEQVPYRKKSQREIQHDIDQIGRMLAMGSLDREIMEKLHLKKTQYYAYRARLYKESGELFDKTTDDELIHQKQILHERFVRLFRRLELDLNQGDISNSNRPGLYLAGESIATNIFKLNFEGLKALQRNGLNINKHLRRIDMGPGNNNKQVGILPRYAEAGTTTQQTLRTTGDTSNKNPIPDESTIY